MIKSKNQLLQFFLTVQQPWQPVLLFSVNVHVKSAYKQPPRLDFYVLLRKTLIQKLSLMNY